MPRLRGRSSWRSERRKPSKPRNACGSKPSRAPSSRGRKSYFPLKRSSWMRSTRKSLGNWPSSRMERPSCNRSSEERLQDGRSILEDGQFPKDFRVDLIQELLFSGKYDFLPLELGAREGLDPQAFRGLLGFLLSDLQELRPLSLGIL